MTGEILKQYTEAGLNERLHLFSQFPDLRESFQEIDRKDLAYHKASNTNAINSLSFPNSRFRNKFGMTYFFLSC